jgi:uncharacterized membrane protein
MSIKTYLITLVVFFVIDIIWLAVVAKDLYKNQIGHLMSKSPNWMAALVFYLIFILGLTYFAINPALAKESLLEALKLGALFGFFTYATYDLTNLATLQDWPLKITIIDLLWGTGLGASVSSLSYFILTKLS